MDKNKEIAWLLKEKYSGKPNGGFYKDIKRLNAGEPLDYVIGFTEFLGCRIDLSKKPLIPRSETEFWVGEVIKNLKIKNLKIRCLDIFAGSGCIGIAVLKHIKNAEVVFADIENRMAGHKVVKSDVFSNINGKFDYIFANPPYVAKKLKHKVRKSVLKYEPKQALFGEGDGLFYIKKFLKQAKNHLNPGGRIFMEFDGSTGSPQVPSQKKEIKKLLKSFGYKNFEFHKDQYNKWRWVSIG